jgi:hypothetical protein
MVLGHPHHLIGQFRRRHNLSTWWLTAVLVAVEFFGDGLDGSGVFQCYSSGGGVRREGVLVFSCCSFEGGGVAPSAALAECVVVAAEVTVVHYSQWGFLAWIWRCYVV